MYQFDTHNRFIDVEVGDRIVSTAIDIGDGYSIQTMAAQLQQKLRAAAPETSGMTVAVNLRVAGLVFTNAGGSFRLLFRSGPNARSSCYAELGFSEQDYASAPEDGIAVLRSVNRVDMSGGRYLELFSSNLANFVPDGLLCQIGMQPGSRLVNYAPDTLEIRQYPQPVQIQDMNVSIAMRRQGEKEKIPYNFNGLWWSITLNVYCVRYAIRSRSSWTPSSSVLFGPLLDYPCVGLGQPCRRSAASSESGSSGLGELSSVWIDRTMVRIV